MEFSPKISIVIPVHNGSNYLREAIDSALAQTYQNREIIVVNDGSRDEGKTEKIAMSYGDEIRYFSKENGGVATALNMGLENMEGQYFSWLSHDDVYYPHKLEAQVQFLRGKENREVILYSDYEVVDENLKLLFQARGNHEELEKKPLYSLFRGYLHGCSILVPKVAFQKAGTFDPSLAMANDYDLWFKMIRVYPFVHQPEILIKSRSHPEQDSKKHPRFIPEADWLFQKNLTALTEEEILAFEPSVCAFFERMIGLLKPSAFKESLNYCELRLNRK